jgi:DNA-binding NtrC family response regulator
VADVLVVEDSEDIAEILALLLTSDGNTVRVAHNGIEGLRLLDQRCPQLVLSDVEMPELDGPAMIFRMFVVNMGLENVPVVLMSGTPELEQVAAAVGTRYFIAKPFPVSELLALMERALSEAIPPRPPLGAEVR